MSETNKTMAAEEKSPVHDITLHEARDRAALIVADLADAMSRAARVVLLLNKGKRDHASIVQARTMPGNGAGFQAAQLTGPGCCSITCQRPHSSSKPARSAAVTGSSATAAVARASTSCASISALM
jgi:hypothetical protein